jgi:uncharacterized pyridoxamine 5'-phosphate oxidase family protein
MEYFNLDSNSHRVSWLEDNGIISTVAFQASGAAKPTVNSEGYLNAASDKMYFLTARKSTKYTEANIAGSMCTN